jgi:hypothetical protein
MLEIQIEKEEVLGFAEKYKATYRQTKIAFNRATNDTLRYLKQATIKELRKEMPFFSLQTVIKARIKQRKITAAKAGGSFFVGLDDLPVKYMNYKKKGKRGRHSISVPGYGTITGAFEATVGGGLGIFRRVGKKRLPIKSVALPVYEEGHPAIQKLVDKETEAFFFRNLERHLKWLVQSD